MATERSKNNVTNLGKGVRRAAGAAATQAEEALREADERLDALADPVAPERRYSFQALVAAGLAGFALGRLLSR